MYTGRRQRARDKIEESARAGTPVCTSTHLFAIEAREVGFGFVYRFH